MRKAFRQGIQSVLLLILAGSLVSCQPEQKTQLQTIQEQGYIKVYTRVAPTTMYVGEKGFSGFEYELMKLFADYLQVDVQITTENDIAKMLEDIELGHADFAAAGLTVTEDRKQNLRFGPPYQEIVSKLVYKQGNVRPRDFDQLDKQLTVIANSSHSEQLNKAKQDYTELDWLEVADLTSLDLLDQVLEGTIDYTVIDSNELDLARQVEPELAIAFSISKPEQLAWVFAKQDDDSLYAKSIEFFSHIRENGSLDYLIERYYGHLSKFDYVGSREFLRAINGKLEQYQQFFIDAAGEDLDWRFLAAMGYQESHWDPKARSPTGVRGLMMLTLNTAKQMKIENRLDAEQSIIGGAKYFRVVKKKVPDRIAEPDRTWFALAGYNVGFGHLEDARKLTEGAGKNPDKWLDVKEFLPLLRQKKWYSKTKYGYARGDEPVRYVNNIRRYYQVLQKLESAQPNQEQLIEEELSEEQLETSDTAEPASQPNKEDNVENKSEVDTETGKEL